MTGSGPDRDSVPDWSMPWLPIGALGAEAIAALDRPLATGTVGWADPEDIDLPSTYMLPWARALAEVGTRPIWYVERIWQPLPEDPPQILEAYEEIVKDIGGVMIAPGCLDDYVTVGYEHYDPDFGKPVEASDLDSWKSSIEWLTAGINVLQVSLPYPFQGALSYRSLDGRPVLRLLYAYATVLELKHPRLARPWFRAMVYMDPDDAMGARFHIAGAARP